MMKTFKDYIYHTKKILVASAFAALMLSLTACPGEDGGGGAIATTPINPVCQGVCPATTTGDTLIRKAFGDDVIGGIRSQLSLNILGDNIYGDGAYVGNVYLTGSYRVEQSNFPGCLVYRGRYNVETTQAGQMNSYGFFGGVQIVATGIEGEAIGHTLQMTVHSLSTGAFSRSKNDLTGQPFDFGLTGDVQITSVDSTQQCQYGSMFLSYMIY